MEQKDLTTIKDELNLNDSHLEQGLSKKDIEQRKKQFGDNEITKKDKNTVLSIFIKQFTNFIIVVLILAAIISLYADEHVNFYVINFIILMVVGLGFFQEYRAEQSLSALKKIIKNTTKVRRNSQIEEVETKELVPGDIIILESGDSVPADAILIESESIKVDESTLTGESVPLEKAKFDAISAGTQVVYGVGQAVVTQIGEKTNFGQIALSIDPQEETTPLQKKINSLTKNLAFGGILVSIFTAFVGYMTGAELHEVLILALTLSVATIPEGLPLTLTVTLMNGTKKLAEKNALVRKLIGVETLGACTYICTDKTGTLTENKMTVQKVLFENDEIPLEKDVQHKKTDKYQDFLQAMVLCNNANIVGNDNKIVGDPTEGALLVFAKNNGIDVNNLRQTSTELKEFFFTSERKMMSVVVEMGNKIILYSKGAPEILLDKCNLSKKEQEKILDSNKEWSNQAHRNLAVAYKVFEKKPNLETDLEKDLEFLGLVGMVDPAKKDAKNAVQTCHKAGISVVMITGDNVNTAISIAKQVGILDKDGHDSVLSGSELDNISDKDFVKIVKKVRVYARVKPEQKLRIVKALQDQGEVVAMTGDGVNDAPAIKKANIGIAMGISGSDVSKESSVIVLEDDNFSTIVKAVELGRGIYENIEKFIVYLVSQNFTEIILIILGLIVLGPELLPLTPIQVLFINTFDEVIPSLSLGFDSFRSNIMKDSPKPVDQNIMTPRNLFLTVSAAMFMGLASFVAFYISNPSVNIEHSRTIAFLSITLMIILRPYSFKSLHGFALERNILDNKLMLISSLFSLIVSISFVYVPFLEKLIGLEPLTLQEWLLPITIAVLSFVWIEVVKLFSRRFLFKK